MSELTPEQRKAFDDILHRAGRLVSLYNTRDEMLIDMERMIHMEWTEKPREKHMKPTLSTSAHDALKGAVRLMTTTAPAFNVNYAEADAEEKQLSGKLEKAAQCMWSGSGRVWGNPLQYDLVYSSLWGSEVVASVSRTSDLVAAMQGMQSSRYLRQAEAALRETPYLYQVHSPLTCYTEYTSLGVSAVLRRSETTWADVLATYGQAAEDCDTGGNRQADERVTMYDWQCYDYRAVWMSGSSDPVWFISNDLPFLPIVSQITDGSRMWIEPEKQREPFLYGLWKSDIWKRENLMLTVIYTMLHGIGSNPQLLHKTPGGESQLTIDRTIPGGVVTIDLDEELGPLVEKVIDPSQMQGLSIAQAIAEGTTIPKVALGAPPSGNMAFSTVSTLIQSGRLPLTGTKQNVANAAAELVRRSLMWMKHVGSTDGLYSAGKVVELRADEIPERIPLTCVLDVDLPSDKLQLANAANGMVDRGLASRRYVREGVLGIGQSDAMDKEIAMERMVETALGVSVEKLKAIGMAQIQAKVQAMMAGGGPQNAMTPEVGQSTGGQGMPPQGAPMQARPQVQPQDGAYPPGGAGVQGGGPLAGPLPPRDRMGMGQ